MEILLKKDIDLIRKLRKKDSLDEEHLKESD